MAQFVNAHVPINAIAFVASDDSLRSGGIYADSVEGEGVGMGGSILDTVAWSGD